MKKSVKKWSSTPGDYKGNIGKQRAYSSWRGMIRRCTESSCDIWKFYGGRGITYHESWNDFEVFYSHMGDRPIGKSLDRINNEGNYEPGNCRWATPREQAQNRRNNVYIDGVCISEMARIIGIHKTVLQYRYRSGKRGDDLLVSSRIWRERIRLMLTGIVIHVPCDSYATAKLRYISAYKMARKMPECKGKKISRSWDKEAGICSLFIV